MNINQAIKRLRKVKKARGVNPEDSIVNIMVYYKGPPGREVEDRELIAVIPTYVGRLPVPVTIDPSRLVHWWKYKEDYEEEEEDSDI